MPSKITQLTEATAPSDGNDAVEIAINTGTTPLSRKIKVLNLLKRLFLGDGTQLTVTTIADGEFVKRVGTNLTSGVPAGTTPAAHAATHENGGADEINVTGLSGVLADPQTPITESVQDIVGAMVVAGTNVTVTYNDGAGTLTIDATGGGGSIAPLVIEDANTVAQRNGATTQVLNLYDEFTGSSNFQRLQFHKNAGGQFEILSDAQTQSVMELALKITGASNALILGSGDLRPGSNRGYNLGGSTSNQFNQLFIFRIDLNGDGLCYTSGPSLVSGGGGWLQMKDQAGSGNLTRISMGDAGSTGVSLTKPSSQTYFEMRDGDNTNYVGVRTKYLLSNAVTFANKPTGVEGMLCAFTDSSTATWGATITGGGSNHVLGYYNGTNWTVAAI